MRIIVETDPKKRPEAQRSYNGVMGIRFQRGKYADAMILGIFKKIFKRLNLVDFTVNTKNVLTLAGVNYFLNNQLPIAYAELFQNGYILIEYSKESGKFKYWQKSEINQFGNEFKTKDGVELIAFYSDTFKVYGKSDAEVLRHTIDGINDALNAQRTVIKRLGAVIVGTPEQPSQNPQAVSINDTDKENLEKDIQKDYGILDDQKQFMFMRRPLKLTRIALGGRDLLITETISTFAKILCDATNIPYDVMALSGQSTYANQEQAEKSMQDTAEEFLGTIWVFLNTLQINFTYTVNNNKYGKQVSI